MLRAGVLGLQGSVIEHINMLKKIKDIEVVSVKKTEDMENLDGLILPGGESTTIGMLLDKNNLANAIIEKAKNGMVVWGTCAGMILMAKHIINQSKTYLSLMDISVVRNAYGSQLDSFETRCRIPEVSQNDIDMVFIRAPYIESTGYNVKVLCTIGSHIVAAEQDNLIATSFHPELTDDTAFYQYFISKMRMYKENK